MNPVVEIDDQTLAALIVADIEEQSKPAAFAKKIARATELIERIGLPDILRPEEAITFEEFKIALLQLGFREETDLVFVSFIHESTKTLIKLALPAPNTWLPMGWLRLKSKVLFEKSLIQTEESLLEIIQNNRMMVEI